MNINRKALSLAHKLKSVYSSFGLALRIAYKMLKSRGCYILITKSIGAAYQCLLKLKDRKKDSFFSVYDYLLGV